MNRLHHLKKTLSENISDNRDYANLEFILLNYNSKDNIEEWIKENFTEDILSGRLKYFFTSQPNEFSHSHSKNLMFRLAENTIVCNINADHLTGKSYAAFVNDQFKTNPNIILTGILQNKKSAKAKQITDLAGKICVLKRDFELLRGFDERMINYGYEDEDFVNRLRLTGKDIVHIESENFNHFIKHENKERFSISKHQYSLDFILSNPVNQYETRIIILYKNNTYSSGTVTNNRHRNSYDYSMALVKKRKDEYFNLKESCWEKGSWNKKANGSSIELINDSNLFKTIAWNQASKAYILNKRKYYVITDEAAISSILWFNFFNENFSIMKDNLRTKKIRLNELGYGQATVFKNFVNDKPIIL